MGGHGGLNILPQKRWNVYNRDNRLKVAQDEAKAQAKEDEARERHEQAEREHRHALLLRRAGGDAGLELGGGAEGDGAAAAATDQEGAEAGGSGAADGQPDKKLEHINFWKEQETKLQHPENEKEQREAAKRRGNPDFYTSDAKFDERFALGYGIIGGDKPWYAQPLKPEPREPSLEQLRAERLAREQAERAKQRGVMAGLPGALPDGPPQKQYNSAFGFAAAMKRRRTQ
eukprot:XP_001691284.1 predicted protein [Chlamydomonas reinhardtii]